MRIVRVAYMVKHLIKLNPRKYEKMRSKYHTPNSKTDREKHYTTISTLKYK